MQTLYHCQYVLCTMPLVFLTTAFFWTLWKDHFSCYMSFIESTNSAVGIIITGTAVSALVARAPK